MKKLLVMMLVLGIASLANATLVITADGVEAADTVEAIIGGPAVQLGVMYDGNLATLAYLDLFDNGLYGLGEPMVTPEAGNLAAAFTSPFAGYLSTELTIADSTGNIIPGLMMTMDYTARDEGQVEVLLFDGATFEVVDSIIISNIVPEPMTMLLLGIGGLFLRRRK